MAKWKPFSRFSIALTLKKSRHQRRIRSMSGHSKWSTIKHQKGVNDAKRGVAFTKLGNAITIAVREGGGGDQNFNFRLRLAVDKAREVNMPKENIQRAVDRGLGKGDDVVLENVLYEGFAPHGVAVLVESVTDNKNRTNGVVRTLFSKANASVGGTGSVSYLFKHLGEIAVPKDPSLTFDSVMEKALEANAEDVIEDGDHFLIYTHSESLHQAKVALENQGLKIASAQLIYSPNKETMVNITDVTEAEQVVGFLESIEDLDDVQNVYSNLG